MLNVCRIDRHYRKIARDRCRHGDVNLLAQFSQVVRLHDGRLFHFERFKSASKFNLPAEG